MPIWIHIANLIVPKDAIAAKFPGGLEAYRAEFNFADPENHQQEDGELFSISAMDPDHLRGEAGRLIRLGLRYSTTEPDANELVILTRYGGVVEQPAWLHFNTAYAWHSNCPPALQAKAESIKNMPLQEFIAKQESGELPYGVMVE